MTARIYIKLSISSLIYFCQPSFATLIEAIHWFCIPAINSDAINDALLHFVLCSCIQLYTFLPYVRSVKLQSPTTFSNSQRVCYRSLGTTCLVLTLSVFFFCLHPIHSFIFSYSYGCLTLDWIEARCQQHKPVNLRKPINYKRIWIRL